MANKSVRDYTLNEAVEICNTHTCCSCPFFKDYTVQCKLSGASPAIWNLNDPILDATQDEVDCADVLLRICPTATYVCISKDGTTATLDDGYEINRACFPSFRAGSRISLVELSKVMAKE
jgi:hypothetical protein